MQRHRQSGYIANCTIRLTGDIKNHCEINIYCDENEEVSLGYVDANNAKSYNLDPYIIKLMNNTCAQESQAYKTYGQINYIGTSVMAYYIIHIIRSSGYEAVRLSAIGIADEVDIKRDPRLASPVPFYKKLGFRRDNARFRTSMILDNAPCPGCGPYKGSAKHKTKNICWWTHRGQCNEDCYPICGLCDGDGSGRDLETFLKTYRIEDDGPNVRRIVKYKDGKRIRLLSRFV